MKRTLITALLLTSFGVAHAATADKTPADDREYPTLSIAVADQNGTSFRLVYSAGNGWRFADHTGPRIASADSRQGPTGPIRALPADTPQSVVVDGPTGYVFVYLMDEGWRFVGNVVDTKR